MQGEGEMEGRLMKERRGDEGKGEGGKQLYTGVHGPPCDTFPLVASYSPGYYSMLATYRACSEM